MTRAALTAVPFGVTTELAAIRRRTRSGIGMSIVAHALLILFLKLVPVDTTTVEGLVEVTWIEPPAPEPAAPVTVARVASVSPVERTPAPALPAPEADRERFVRELPRAETAPQPQRSARDAVRDRLASLARTATEARTQIATLLPQADAPRPTRAAASSAEPTPRALARGEPSPAAPAPSPLVRASVAPTPSTTALAQLVAEPVPSRPAPNTSVAAFPARQVLAGVSLAGPVVDRALVQWRLPTYPEWAKREAVEGSVRLRFVVRPDGGVKEDIMVEKTSGYEDFDRNATVALLGWLFEPRPGTTGDQWGSITLDYRLDSLR